LGGHRWNATGRWETAEKSGFVIGALTRRGLMENEIWRGEIIRRVSSVVVENAMFGRQVAVASY
jgi:hypothetical protein